MWDDEGQDDYLEQNPHIECGMWSEWVVVVCGWDKIEKPNSKEWDYLRSKWYSGMAPIDSVAQLKQLRAQ